MYHPAEDSFLLAEVVRSYTKQGMKVLDMGTGSGIQAKTAIKSGAKDVLAVDIDPLVIKKLKRELSPIQSDLFSKVKGKFDLIIFNPPYLPADKHDKGLDTTAGKKGYELIIKFLKQAKSHLSKDGTILLLISSLSKPSVILKEARKHYRTRKVAEKKIFFEKLYVYKLSPQL